MNVLMFGLQEAPLSLAMYVLLPSAQMTCLCRRS